MEKNKIMKLAAFCLPLMLLASCGTKKQIISDSVNNKNLPHQEVKSVETERMQKLAFVQKVSDNQVYAKNITGSMNFTIRMGEKKISVDGALRMRKDDVIRSCMLLSWASRLAVWSLPPIMCSSSTVITNSISRQTIIR